MKRKRPTAEHKRLMEEREEWAWRFLRCFACGKVVLVRGKDNHVHEIIRRSETNKWADPRNYVLLCPPCHEQAHGGWLTKPVLATLKMLLDPSNYDMDWLQREANAMFEHAALPEQCLWTLSHDAKQTRC